MSIQFFKNIQMQYLLAIYLAWFLTVGHFSSVPWKRSLSNLIYVVIMMPSLWILLSIIHGGKSVKGIENVEIKAKQNHTFKSLFEVFFRFTWYQHSNKKYFFIILHESKNSACLKHNIRRASNLQWMFL